jgi:2-aminoethylphosphonate-pyruvate transaminase
MKKPNKPFKMMTAGPVNVSDTVKQSLIYPEIGHRESEFSELYGEIRGKLLQVFKASSNDYSSFVIGGSGTAGIESVLSGTVHYGRKMLVINNGAFGDRMAEICRIYRIPTLSTDYRWGDYPNLDGIERLLLEKSEIEAVSMVFMETSTGMINPIKEVGSLCKKYDKMFVVDAVSGLAGDPLDVQESNIDFCISNTNKGISGLPVISFVCAKKNSVEGVRDIPLRNFYLSMLKHYDYAEKANQTPTTPQIPLFYMLNQALNELLEEGIENRHKRYMENSNLMREILSNIGFRFQLPEEQMSNVMTNVLIPENYGYEEFHTPLKEKGYIIYPGKGPLDGKVLHIANVGTHTQKDVGEFCDALAEIVRVRKIEY